MNYTYDNLNTFLKDVYEEGVEDTICTMCELFDDANDIFTDSLAEENPTVTECVMAQHWINEYRSILLDLIVANFSDPEDECDGDCENCPHFVEE